ncbi:MAG: hypothetical protein ACFB8W_04225 [Elainellaceae cyanobacterium]
MNEAHFFIGGNVTIHPSAVIASGVLLQADPDSQLRIAAGVSIGAGSILHAHRGILEVRDHATIGSRVLIMGHGLVGQRACIGADTSVLYQVKVDAQQVISPGSLLGDPGSFIPMPAPPADTPPSNHRQPPERSNGEAAPPAAGDPDAAPADQGPSSTPTAFVSSSTSSTVKFAHVYGRASVERLMQMMFYRNGSGQQMPDPSAQSVNDPPDHRVEE